MIKTALLIIKYISIVCIFKKNSSNNVLIVNVRWFSMMSSDGQFSVPDYGPRSIQSEK